MSEPTDISTDVLVQWCEQHREAAVHNHGEWTPRVYPEADESKARSLLEHPGYEVRPRAALDCPGFISIRFVGSDERR